MQLLPLRLTANLDERKSPKVMTFGQGKSARCSHVTTRLALAQQKTPKFY